MGMSGYQQSFGRRAPTQEGAFTLVEVALALAAAALAITGLFVVLAAALSTARTAADDTLVATIAQDLFAEIRRQPFTNVRVESAAAVDLSSYAGTGGELFYDQNGSSLASATGAYFRCALDYELLAPTGCLAGVRLTFYWPAGSGLVRPANTNIFYSQVVRLP